MENPSSSEHETPEISSVVTPNDGVQRQDHAVIPQVLECLLSVSASTSSVSGSTSSVSASTSSVSVEEVPIFWDFNTCPLVAPAKDLVKNIEKSLGQLHHLNPLTYPKYILSTTRIACGDLKNLSIADQNCLKRQGFQLFHCHERYAYCPSHPKPKPNTPAPELQLEACLIDYVIQRGSGSGSGMHKNILFVSGDYDVGYSLYTLWKRGYTVFLAINRLSEEQVLVYVNHAWYWDQMQYGSGDLIRSIGDKCHLSI